MPQAALKLVGGVDTESTAVLNENSGVSQSQLIRFFYSPVGVSSIQKIGGWSRFFPYPFPATVRALWAWEDLNLESHLAVGTEAVASTGQAQLSVITDGNIDNITPTALTDNITPVLSTTAGSYTVLITDTTTEGITPYNSVYIATQIAIGGIVLFGLYQCDPDGFLAADAYTVFSTNILGEPNPATTNSSAPVLPLFTTVLGELTATVTLPLYTYAPGDTFPVLVPTTVGGVTFYGNYVVQTLIDANNFTILGPTVASASTSGYLNNGLARYVYSFGQGVLPGGTGYGSGTYGSGGYGTGTPVVPSTGSPIDAIDWTLDNFGEVLIACPDRVAPADGTPFQPIYAWNPGAAAATIITAAPPVNDGIFVAMPQRQIIAWGSTETGIQDPLLINWCDVGNPGQWIALVTNQAGSYRIPKGSRIVGCAQGPQQAIVWTDIDVWSMQYVGTPYVYSFNEIGAGCGLIARKAAASINGIYYWMGPSQFYSLSSAAVQPIPCSVWDAIFQNLDQSNLQKIRVAVNSRFGEIQWFYPSVLGGTGEVDSYVKYNIYLNVWDYGILGRTAWVDQSVLGPPIGADPTTLLLYQHETSNDADGAAMASSFQTGYYTLQEGDFQTFVDWVWPDMKWGQYDAAQTATVMIEFFVKNYPSDTPQQFGPYSVTQATQYFYTRLRGRLVSIKISSNDLGSWWRLGLIRYRYAMDGRI
jgi:hypothetical protein